MASPAQLSCDTLNDAIVALAQSEGVRLAGGADLHLSWHEGKAHNGTVRFILKLRRRHGCCP